MTPSQRVWTETEKKWKTMLEGDEVYEIMPMSVLYPTLPEPDAYDVISERCGHPDMAGWCKLIPTSYKKGGFDPATGTGSAKTPM